MKCAQCKRQLKDRDRVVPILTVVGNEKRGDFVGGDRDYVHIRCFAVMIGGK